MKIVIDIPNDYAEQFYKNKCKDKFDSLATNEFGYVLRKAFEDAKSLPKHHGRLIDADKLKSMYSINQGNFNTVVGIQKWIDYAPTIIEAEESEEE